MNHCAKPTQTSVTSSAPTAARRRRSRQGRKTQTRLLVEVHENRSMLASLLGLGGAMVDEISHPIDRGHFESQSGPANYADFVARERAGQVPSQQGVIASDPGSLDGLANNNTGSTGTAYFTQSETTVVAFGNTVVIGFNDSGSNSGGTNKFTGYSRSTDGGVTPRRDCAPPSQTFGLHCR